MGTKMAPTYATLVLGYLEELMYREVEKLHGEEFSSYIEDNFWRFLDDCFIIWPPGKDIHDFLNVLNSLHSSIKFTMEMNDTSLPFLDVLVKLYNNMITTDIFCKSTDSHNYLNFHSSHTKHIKLNIPFNLASRLVTIVSDSDILNLRLSELEVFLTAQGYPKTVISNGIQKAISMGPFSTRAPKTCSSKEILPFVSTFNPQNVNMFPIIRNKFEELKQTSDHMKTVLDKYTLINSKRQPKNLKRLLICSKFESVVDKPKVSKCKTPRCGTCDILIECSTFTFKNDFTFTVRTNMNCKSSNVIYSVICNNCNEFYIGQTGNELRKRMTVHRQQSRTEHLRFLNVSKHIHDCSNDEFRVFPLYQMYSSDVIKRESKEAELIKLLKPKLNSTCGH